MAEPVAPANAFGVVLCHAPEGSPIAGAAVLGPWERALCQLIACERFCGPACRLRGVSQTCWANRAHSLNLIYLFGLVIHNTHNVSLNIPRRTIFLDDNIPYIVPED